MKKIISIMLVFVMMLALASCANAQKPDWQTSLDLGQKYLLDGNYEQAIIEFNKVIEIEPKNVEAYIGLAEAYAAQGDYSSAIAALEQGYAETGNQTLQDKIEAVTALPGSIANQDTDSQIIRQVILGDYHSAAITEDGSLYVWGDNYYGQLGNDTTEDSSVPVKIMDDVVSASLGHYHSGAITSDGSLYMWGWNENGKLGNFTTLNSSAPLKIMDDVVYVSLGLDHSAAITADGILYTWGDNDRGQLGRRTGSNIGYPINIMDNVASVSLGTLHSAAITTDGTLYTWGNSWYGQLGNAENTYSNVPIKIMDNVVSVSLGEYHSAAITSDRSLYMWGSNYSGQLGNGNNGGDYYNYVDGVDSNIPIKIMDDVVSVSLGSSHSAAITTDGSLYMWGSNHYGQLGNGTNEDSYVPIKIMDNVVAVCLGEKHSAAITTDGSLYMWGHNNSGQLGNGTIEDSNVPIKIEIPVE